MTVLVLDTCRDALSAAEFVAPIARIVRDAAGAAADVGTGGGAGAGAAPSGDGPVGEAVARGAEGGVPGSDASDGGAVRVVRYRELDPGALAEASHIIICGTALQDDEYLNHQKHFEWLRDTDRPVLAICSGMQALALQFGARLVDCTEIGMVTVQTEQENPLCAGRFEAYALHRHAVEGLSRFEVLARSGSAAQVIRHRQRPLWGVLFHPEVRHEAVVRRFLAL